MGKFTPTKEDIMRAIILKPDFYPVQITRVVDSPASTDQSLNTTVHGRVIGGEFDGVPLRTLFNEKNPGYLKNFVEALGYEWIEGKTYDITPALIGKQMKWYVSNGKYNGRMQNNVEDYAPIS